MVTNNEAVENFLNGKRNLAAYQFTQLIKELNFNGSGKISSTTNTTGTSSSVVSTTTTNSTNYGQSNNEHNNNTGGVAGNTSSSSSSVTTTTNNEPNSDEIAFNYAMINHFTGCHQRSSLIFNDLVKRYPRNPRLWLRLAESMLANEREKINCEFDHIQQLTDPHSRDHLLRTKNKHILIKINPNYCQQQIQQHIQLQRRTPSNFLVTIKGQLEKSLELINEYNDISLLTDDVPNSDHQVDQSVTGGECSTSSQITSSTLLNDDKNTITIHESHHKLSQQLSFANPYKSITRSDLYNLKIKVLLNLAYITLCMGEPNKALNFSTQCLKASPHGYERVMAHLYHAEACILTGRIDEAIQYLDLEIFNIAKSLPIDHPSVTGNTNRIVYGKDIQDQLKTGALTTVLTYNLSVAYAAKGEMGNAQKILMKSIEPTKSNPMQLLICLLYLQLQQGQLESAERTILNNLPQFR